MLFLFSSIVVKYLAYACDKCVVDGVSLGWFLPLKLCDFFPFVVDLVQSKIVSHLTIDLTLAGLDFAFPGQEL